MLTLLDAYIFRGVVAHLVAHQTSGTEVPGPNPASSTLTLGFLALGLIRVFLVFYNLKSSISFITETNHIIFETLTSIKFCFLGHLCKNLSVKKIFIRDELNKR